MNDRAVSVPAPCVSIGMPVYNAERYLDAALASLVAQDFQDFEIIICDNASVDGTAAIAAAWVARDPRIRYVANSTNIGVEPNFNRVLDYARGRYFRWAAHDDLVACSHLSRCIAALEAAPDAVLCQSFVQIIDSDGAPVGIYDSGLRGAESLRASDRFAAVVLSRHLCTDIYGLMRTDTLRGTRLHGSYFGSDRALLAELALMGRFLHVPEPLFMNREHPGRGSRVPRRQTASARCGPPIWHVYADYWRAVGAHLRDRRERVRCRTHLLRWWLMNWNPARLGVELISAIHPPVHDWVDRLKLRIYGPLPQVRLERRESPPARRECSRGVTTGGHKEPGV